jgi:hypothetical protein
MSIVSVDSTHYSNKIRLHACNVHFVYPPCRLKILSSKLQTVFLVLSIQNQTYTYCFISPIKFDCEHSQLPHLSRTICKVSKLGNYLVGLIVVTILFPTSLYFSLLPKMYQVKDKTLCLINYADALFIVSNAVLASIIFFKLELQEQKLKTWIEIYTKRKFYGLGDILRNKKSKQITLRKRCESAIVIFLLVAMVIPHFAFSYDNLEWSFTRKCGIILCFGMHCYGVLDATAKIYYQ